MSKQFLKLSPFKDKIIGDYKEGKSAKIISKELFVNYKTVYKFLKDNGITVRNNRDSHNAYYKNEINLSANQTDALNGWLLGDGCLVKTDTPQSFFSLSTIHLEYAEYVVSLLSPSIKCSIAIDRRPKYKSGKSYLVSTKRSTTLSTMRALWYPKQKKIVPKSLELSPITIANWIMDDGTIDRSHNTVHIYTCSFGLEDIGFLIRLLKEIVGNENHISICNKNTYPFIYLSKKSSNSLFDYIGSCPVSCFDYKWAIHSKRIENA